MTYRLARYIVPLRIVVIGVTAVIGGAFAWLGLVGDGHEAPVRQPYAYDVVEVCPSAAWALPALEKAGRGYAEQCVPVLPMVLSACDGPPAAGVAQVRDHRDQVVGLTADVSGPYVDRIAHLEDRAVAYLLEPREVLACTPGHLLGHLLGFRAHATAATSVMADPCGPAFTHLNVCEDR